MSRLALKKAEHKDQRYYLQTVRDSADALLALINDILDLSAIETGNIKFEHIGFNLKSLMNSLIDYRFSVGMDMTFGDKLIDLTFSRWQTAIDGGLVNSIAIGFVAPGGVASDVELRMIYDESENFGSTFALAVSFYYFGA